MNERIYKKWHDLPRDRNPLIDQTFIIEYGGITYTFSYNFIGIPSLFGLEEWTTKNNESIRDVTFSIQSQSREYTCSIENAPIAYLQPS